VALNLLPGLLGSTESDIADNEDQEKTVAPLRSIPIHRVGTRENLFLDADREMTMLLALVCFALVFSAQEWRAGIYGTVLWFTGLYLLRKAAKYDAKLRHVYLRHIRYARYYPARSTPFRVNTHNQGRQYR
jgi:type IV secretion system protein TrbD